MSYEGKFGDEGGEEGCGGGAGGGELRFQRVHQGHQLIHFGHDTVLFGFINHACFANDDGVLLDQVDEWARLAYGS